MSVEWKGACDSEQKKIVTVEDVAIISGKREDSREDNGDYVRDSQLSRPRNDCISIR